MKANERKEKAVDDLKVAATYTDVVVTVHAMVDAILRSHEISAPQSM